MPSAGCEPHGDGSSGTSARRVEAQLSFALISFVFSCLRLVLLCRSCIKTYIICVCDVEVMCRISIWHDQSFIIYIGLPKFGHAKVLARNFGTHFSLISVLYSNLKGIIHFHNRTIHELACQFYSTTPKQNARKEGTFWSMRQVVVPSWSVRLDIVPFHWSALFVTDRCNLTN